jgi:hypothetical protein
MGDAGILAGKNHACFRTILTALGFAGKTPMQAFEALEFGTQGFGILDDPTIGALGQSIDPHIDSDWLGHSRWRIRHFLLHLNGDKPPACLLGHRCGKNFSARSRHISTFFQAQSAQTRQINGVLVDMNGTGSSETA